MALMQVNASFKKAAPAPAKTIVKKSPKIVAIPKKVTPKPLVKAKPISKKAAAAPVKNAPVFVKKAAVTVKKANAGKSAAAQKGDGLAKWYGKYIRYVKCFRCRYNRPLMDGWLVMGVFLRKILLV
jgi:rare lipoprotein A (peptidoglycan hydrolase)